MINLSYLAYKSVTMGKGKSIRNKQVAVAFERNLADYVAIDTSLFLVFGCLPPSRQSMDGQEKEIDPLGIYSFVDNLIAASSLQDQMKVVQCTKSSLKAAIMNPVENTSTGAQYQDYVVSSIKMLLLLYVHPNYIGLRKPLEWVMETLTRCKCLETVKLKHVLRETCEQLLKSHEFFEFKQGDKSIPSMTMTVEEMLSWSFTFNCMAALNKDLLWLSSDESMSIVEGSVVLPFISALEKIFFVCATEIVRGSDSSSNSTSSVTSSGASSTEILRYAECCGESMRGIMTVIKSRMSAYIPRIKDAADESSRKITMWHELINRMMKLGADILMCDKVNKDVITQTAMGMLFLQWTSRFSLGNSVVCERGMSLNPSLQLFVLLQCVGLEEIDKEQDAFGIHNSDDGANVLTEAHKRHDHLLKSLAEACGVHPHIASCVQHLPMISKCAILRACLAVFDNKALSFQPILGLSEQPITNILNQLGLSANCTSYISLFSNLRSSTSTSVNIPSSDNVALSDLSNGNILSDNSLFFNEIFRAGLAVCMHSLPVIRFYGFQTLELWFNRLSLEITPVSASASSSSSLPDASNLSLSPSKTLSTLGGDPDKVATIIIGKLQLISGLLIGAWSHPSKQISHMVPTLFQRSVDTLDTICKLNGVKPETASAAWKHFIAESLAQPGEHRGRYQTMNMLLPKVGARLFMDAQPQVIQNLVNTVRVRDVCSSACTFVGTLIKKYASEEMETRGVHDASEIMVITRSLWVEPVINALCSSDHKMRMNATDYLLPEILSIDSAVGPYLLDYVRSPKYSNHTLEDKLWALVNICFNTRLLNLPGKDVIPSIPEGGSEMSDKNNLSHSLVVEGLASQGLLTEQELTWACLSEDVNLRLVCLNLITASLRTSVPLAKHELHILKRTLQYSFKSTQVDHRHRIVRSIKSLLIRVTEMEKSASRDLAKLGKRAETLTNNMKKLGGQNDEERGGMEADLNQKLIENARLMGEAKSTIESAYEVYAWLSSEILNNLYPGTTSDREMMALDVFNCVIETVDASILNAPDFVACFFSETMTNTILNLLISGWDRSRRMAADLILKFPRPIPYHTTVASVNSLITWGCNLTGSPRQRESEAGALILRDLFCIYCLHLKWSDITIPQSAFDNTGISSVEKHHHSDVKDSVRVGDDVAVICTSFLQRTCDLLEMRLKSLEKLLKRMDAESEPGNSMESFAEADNGEGDANQSRNDLLCHGLLMALRLCLQVVRTEGLFFEPISPNSQSQSVWQPLIQRLQQLSMSSLQAAMKVVAEAPSDSAFAPLPTNAIRLLNARNGGNNGNGTISPFVIRSLLGGQAGVSTMLNTITSDNHFEGSKGPVNASNAANMSMAASYVNTNSVMGGGTDGDAIDEKGAEAQRAVVAAWLLVKESAAMLSFLVEISPPTSTSSPSSTSSAEPTLTTEPSASSQAQDETHSTNLIPSKRPAKNVGVARTISIPLLSVSEISHIGWTMLDALGRLKHMGAIAEAHCALQTISEVLLRHGDRNSDLCRLPCRWLLAILGRLECEQQVSILRRSAGFAYSFLSILRAEPANCKPTLLHIAMQSLLLYAERGLISSAQINKDHPSGPSNAEAHKLQPGSEVSQNSNELPDKSMIDEYSTELDQQAPQISWRICVHALNVLRLIITDAALGTDIDFYIARAAKMAVSGFRSPKWAVRNSSMMVFTAVVQRSIDNDKNESGGAKASTAQEFFRRFPSLYPFLLTELANVTHFQVVCDEEGWPVKVDKESETQIDVDSVESKKRKEVKDEEERKKQKEYRVHHGGMHPSLYPILLMLSQMRASMTESTNLPSQDLSQTTSIPSPEGSPAGSSSPSTTPLTGQREANLSLFVPLVIHCCRERVHKAREMASKALVSVVSLQDVPVMTADILSGLLGSISPSRFPPSKYSLPSRPTTNEVQGFLLLAYGLFQNLNKQRGSLSTTISFYKMLSSQTYTVVLPVLADLIVELAHVTIPPIQMLMLRLIRTVKEFFQDGFTHDSVGLLAGQCRICLSRLHSVWDADSRKEKTDSSKGRLGLLPGQPMLWKESILEMVKLSISAANLEKGSSKYHDNGPYSPFSLSFLLSLLAHPISEVREGVLLGCKDVLMVPSHGQEKQDSILSSASLLLSHNFMWELFHAMSVEKEPPILSLGMFVLVELSHAAKVITSKETNSNIAVPPNSWQTLMKIASPSSVSKSSTTTPISISPTVSAASAVEMLGWIVGQSLKVDTKFPLEDSDRIKGMLNEWVIVLEVAVDDEQPADIREASSKSIMASNFLTFFNQIATTVTDTSSNSSELLQQLAVIACRVWVCAIRLLQDDDEDARIEINRAVVNTLVTSSGNASLQTASNAFVTVPGYTLESLGDHVAVAIAISSSPTSSSPFSSIDILWSEIQRLSGKSKEVSLVVSTDKQALAERIFEKEIANLYVEGEKAVKVLVNALYLGLLKSQNIVAMEEVQIRIFSKALQAVNLLNKALEELVWLGGVTLQQELFIFVNAVFHATVTLAKLPLEVKEGATGGGGRSKEVLSLSQELSAACRDLITTGEDIDNNLNHEKQRIHPWIKAYIQKIAAGLNH